jgi:hypothetical protein
MITSTIADNKLSSFIQMASTRKRASCLVSLTPPRVTLFATLAQEHVSPAKQIKFPRRSIRTNGPITCCDFGVDRLQKFPGADFCHPCKLWDDRDIFSSRASRNSKKYMCQRAHNSLSSPQQLVSKWWNLSDRQQSNVTVDAPSTPVSRGLMPSPRQRNNNKYIRIYCKKKLDNYKKDSAAELERLHEEVYKLNAKLNNANKARSKLHTDLKKAKRMVNSLQQRNSTLVAKKMMNGQVQLKKGYIACWII